MNFNAKSFIKKAGERTQLQSISMKDLLLGLEKEGAKFGGVKIVHSKQYDKDYLILGTFDDRGFTVPNTAVVNIAVSNKLNLEGATDAEKFMEIYDNYPVYYGKTENGEWLSVAPASGEPVPATSIDFAALLNGKAAKAGVPSLG